MKLNSQVKGQRRVEESLSFSVLLYIQRTGQGKGRESGAFPCPFFMDKKVWGEAALFRSTSIKSKKNMSGVVLMRIRETDDVIFQAIENEKKRLT